ncbi:hypothetical protein [Vibrio mediterranei]
MAEKETKAKALKVERMASVKAAFVEAKRKGLVRTSVIKRPSR